MIVTWAHLDANRHMRNTAYSEFATHARINYFKQADHGIDALAKQKTGPILLREELIYLREVRMHEQLCIEIELTAMTDNYSHYTICHTFLKENKKVAAKVIIDGAWIDLESRKLCLPSSDTIHKVIKNIPKSKNFTNKSYRDYIFL